MGDAGNRGCVWSPPAARVSALEPERRRAASARRPSSPLAVVAAEVMRDEAPALAVVEDVPLESVRTCR